jgi:hypothetical protein
MANDNGNHVESHSSTGPGVVGGFGQRPGVVDIKHSGFRDDVALPIQQSFAVIALLLIAMLTSAAAVVRWFYVIDQFVSRGIEIDLRVGMPYYLVIGLGVFAFCVVAVKLIDGRELDVWGWLFALCVIALATVLYTWSLAPVLVFALRDWIVMAATGVTGAMWIGVRMGVNSFRDRLDDPLIMEDSPTRVARENRLAAVELYSLKSDDEIEHDQRLNDLAAQVSSLTDNLQKTQAVVRYHEANPLVVWRPHNTGTADGTGVAPVEPYIMYAIINRGLSDGDISRDTWIKRIVELRRDAGLPDFANTETYARKAWENAMGTLKAHGYITGLKHKPYWVPGMTPDKVTAALKLPPHPSQE